MTKKYLHQRHVTNKTSLDINITKSLAISMGTLQIFRQKLLRVNCLPLVNLVFFLVS